MNQPKLPPTELTAVLAALEDVGPKALTSCPGWTAHYLAAHICGNYEEVHRHVQAFAADHPLDHTRLWEEREAPLRELDYRDLLRRIDAEAAAAADSMAIVLEQRPDATLDWTGRIVPVSGFATHLRSEDALHRWDLVGDDDLSGELLAQEELLSHAVKFIGQPLLRNGLSAGAGSEPFVARIRCAGQEDLIVEAGGGTADILVGPVAGIAAIESDPSARLLMLWGRKPMPFSRLEISEDSQRQIAVQAQALLAGY